jgi:hypothetical protein
MNNDKSNSKPNTKKSMLDKAKSAWKSISSSVKNTNNYSGDSVNLIQREIDKQSGENFDFAPNILPDAQHERYSSLAKIPSFDWMNNRWYNYPISINENKLSPKESLQRKLKKQRYKVSYVQDGKKVEVFASSIRGVRRVVYGKKQYRVHNSTGSDVTGYFKKLLGE